MQQNQVAFLFCRNKRMQIPVSGERSAGILRKCASGRNRRWLEGAQEWAPCPEVFQKWLTTIVKGSFFGWRIYFWHFLQTNEILTHLNITFTFGQSSPEHLQMFLLNQSAACFLRSGDIVFEVQIPSISITKDCKWLNIPDLNEALTVVFSLHYSCIQAYKVYQCM